MVNRYRVVAKPQPRRLAQPIHIGTLFISNLVPRKEKSAAFLPKPLWRHAIECKTNSYMYSFWKFMSAYVFKPSLLLWQSSKTFFFFFQGILLRIIFQLDIWYLTEKSIWRTLAVSQRNRFKKNLSELTVGQLLGKHFTRQKSSTLTKRTKKSSLSECRWNPVPVDK